MKFPKLFATIGFRLMLFNALVVFLPLAALLYLDIFEAQLLEAQEQSMASQARILAAALSVQKADYMESNARTILSLVASNTRTRLRILSPQSTVLADSSTLVPQAATPATTTSESRYEDSGKPDPEDPLLTTLYRIGSLPFRLFRLVFPAPQPDATQLETTSLADNRAVQAALAGRYGAWTGFSPGQRSVTLYCAFPVLQADKVQAVVLASQSTLRILQSIYEVRLSLFKIFLASLAVAMVLSLLASLTISRPLSRMRAMAEQFVDQWGRPIGSFKPLRGSAEIASLSRSLVRLGEGLCDHVHFIESFASDLAHEARNPLAAIRASAELLLDQSDASVAQHRLATIIARESDRLDRLLGESLAMSRLDVALERTAREIVDVELVLSQASEAWRLRNFNVEFRQGCACNGPHQLLANAVYLRQALDALIDNAASFSPANQPVELHCRCRGPVIELLVQDHGPGVDTGQEQVIFSRFHTTRKDSGHSGTGLSLAASIVQAFGGTIAVHNQAGAIFTLSFPAVKTAP